MVNKGELFQSKCQAMMLMGNGASWEGAKKESGLNYSRQWLQHLYREWQKRGDEALSGYRHGHPHKATSEIRKWISERCSADAEVRASRLSVEIGAEFGVKLHHDYVGLLRRQLGLPVPREGSPGKKQEKEPAKAIEPKQDFSP